MSQRTFNDQFLESGAIFGAPDKDYLFIGYGAFKEQASALGENNFLYKTDFNSKTDKPYIIYENFEKIKRSDFLKKFKTISLDRAWEPPKKQLFSDYFHKIKNSKKYQKMVPVVYEKSCGAMTRDELSTLLYNLSSISNEYIYGCWHGNQGVLGASPELLFSIEGNVIKTMALAGTASLKSPDGSLLKDSKELKEHQYVIDDVCNQLNKISKKVILSKTAEVKLKVIKHLKTEIKADALENVSLKELVSLLHPTPALGVFPRSKNWRKDLESVRESIGVDGYGAPLGFFNDDKLEAIVAIRSIQWKSEALYIGSGCGVVAESMLDNEWNELELKRSAVKEKFGYL